MAESVSAMRLVNLRSVTCYTDQNFKEKAHFGALNLFTSEKRLKLSSYRRGFQSVFENFIVLYS